jgi:nucleoside-diphosphate-sugar epimerase
MKALFIGGSGILSSACVALAEARGVEVSVLNRGERKLVRPWSTKTRVYTADVRDRRAVENALAGQRFDVVVDFVAFEPEHIEQDLELFRGRVSQYIFISSASVYRKPILKLPIYESTPLGNAYWQYARSKIACEKRLNRAYEEEGFPITIVRPSHTYDRTLLPFSPHGAGPTFLARLKAGKPIVVHGDGTSLWTLTHHRDFALGLVGLLGHPATLGECFHITSDEALPWNEIARAIARAAGVEPAIVHVPSDELARLDPEWGAGLLGDKAHSAVFDNSKIRNFVPQFRPEIPFFRGAQEIVEYYETRPELLVTDPHIEALIDELARRYGARVLA